MKIEYLKEFLAVSKHLSFCRAAEELFVSESALSRHISSLEKELGAVLLYRDTQTVRLTPIGTNFYHKMTNIIQQYDDVCGEIKLQASGYESTIRLGVPYYAMSDYLGTMPLNFTNANPTVSLSYYASNPQSCLQALMQNEVDAIITAKMPYEISDQLVFQAIYREPFIVIMSKDHRLSGMQSVSPEDLVAENLISVDSPFYDALWTLLNETFAIEDVSISEPKKYKQIENVFTECQMNAGITIAGWHMRKHAYGKLTYVPFDDPRFVREVCLVYKKSSKHPAIKKLLQAFNGIGTYGWDGIVPEWAKTEKWKNHAQVQLK